MTQTTRELEASRAASRTAVERSAWIVAWILAAGAVLVPLVLFDPWWDPYARPKAIVLSLIVVAGLGAAGVGLVRGWNAGAMPRLRWFDAAVMVFAILMAAATLTSVDVRTSLFGRSWQYQGLAALSLYLASFYLARFAFRDLRRVQVLFAAIAVGGAAAAAYAVAQKIGIDPFSETISNGRAIGPLGDPNALASYLVVAMLPTIALVFSGPKWARLPAAGVSALLSLGIAVTFSRGGYVGLGVAVGVFVLAVVGADAVRPGTIALVAAGVLAVALAAVLFVGPARTLAASVVERAVSTADTSDFSILERMDLWQVGVRVASDHPLVGTGPDTFAVVWPEYRDQVVDPDRLFALQGSDPASPHNLFIATAQGAGLPALAALLVALIGVFVILAQGLPAAASRATRVTIAAVIAAGVGFLVTNMFMTAELTGSWLLWVLLGAGLALAGTASESPGTA